MSQLKKSPVAKAVAFAAVLLLLAAGQSLATDDKQDKTVKGRIEILEALVKGLQGDRDDLEKKLSALRTEYDAHKVNESAHHIPGEDLSDRVEDLEDLLEHFSRDGNDICIAGANLRVVNGTDTTDGTPNGLGNIIIGYNEKRGTGGLFSSEDLRTGSHMLVVGKENDYSGFGGIVVGRHNTTRGEYASVSGGCSNTASGEYASVSGGCGRGASKYVWTGGGLSSLYSDYYADYWVTWHYVDENGDGYYQYVRLQDN